ncbi:MAG: FAD-binding protein [Clostridia bacterium]|nr:FAD-binding protein [Clostridia bacterium]
MVKLRNGIVLENEPMSRHASFRIGGRARLVKTDNIVDVMSIMLDCERIDKKLYLIGGGTNLLINSGDLTATFLSYTDNTIYIDKGNIVCSAGVTIAEFLRFCVAHSITGYEFMAGIPGTMGGAVKGNAGGVNVAIGDYVLGVNLLMASHDMCGVRLTSHLDKVSQNFNKKINKKIITKIKAKNIKIINNKIINKKILKNNKKTIKNHIFSKNIIKKIYLDKNKLIFNYRKSNIADNYFIKNVILKCQYGDRQKIAQSITTNLTTKITTQPTKDKSAGSVFMRVGDFVPAREIDLMGLKGMSVGSAKVSEVHAGFVVNIGNATSQDIIDLVTALRQKVYDKHGVWLQSEIKYFD